MTWSLFFVLQELDAQIESLRDELRLADTLPDGRNAHLEERSAAARREATSIRATLDAREAKRAETAAGLPEAYVRRYDRLRTQQKLRPWVVGLTGKHCPACNLVLPSAFLSDARRTGEPVSCPNCHRMLIWRSDPIPSSGAAQGGSGR